MQILSYVRVYYYVIVFNPKKIIMKNRLIFSILFILSSVCCYSQNMKLSEELMMKHKDFLTWRFGVFFHFNVGTFCNMEWATGYEDPLIFNPTKLDCNQWVSEAKNAGMTYAVLTTKHTGGWCLWDSEYTSHDITAMKNYKDGKGDIVREFVDACRKNGMRIGFYYCLPGNFSDGKLKPGQEDLHGLPPEAKGNYETFIENQIKELFTKYGKIDIFFADQFINPYTPGHWRKVKKLIHELQPECIVVANNARDYKDTDIIGYEHPWLKSQGKPDMPPKGNKEATEVNDCIVDGPVWFWHSDFEPNLQSAEVLINKLRFCNENNANYLLNVQPDNTGLLSGKYLERLHEVAEINKKEHFIK